MKQAGVVVVGGVCYGLGLLSMYLWDAQDPGVAAATSVFREDASSPRGSEERQAETFRGPEQADARLEIMDAGGGFLGSLRERHPGLFREILEENEGALVRGMLSRLASENPSEAVALLSQISDLADRKGHIITIAEHFAAIDPAAAYGFVQSRRGELDEAEYEALLSSLAGPMAERDPTFAASIVSSIGDASAREKAMVDLANGWAASDPSAALRWLEATAQTGVSSAILSHCYIAVMKGSMREDPVGTAESILFLESAQLQSQLGPEMAAVLAESSLDGAMEWVGIFNDSGLRRSGMESLLVEHARKAPGETLQAIIASPELFAGDPELAFSAFYSLARADASLVADRFSEIPVFAQGSAAEAIALGLFESGASPERVTRALRQIPPGPARDRAVESLVANRLDDGL